MKQLSCGSGPWIFLSLFSPHCQVEIYVVFPLYPGKLGKEMERSRADSYAEVRCPDEKAGLFTDLLTRNFLPASFSGSLFESLPRQQTPFFYFGHEVALQEVHGRRNLIQ